MQVIFNRKKAGVSLIAVLMFMMIATIAATATWKWITSEGKSSSSRMLKREAYQSAMAGIENTRAWMTYHANDVGSLIRQYIDGGSKPINLDSRLRTLQRAGQAYHVWLTGVNIENSTYKLKIYSAGEARNETKHNEVAIFNVDGLYRITIPKQNAKKVNDFDYNYFGGTTTNHGDIFVRSMLVNGNLTGGNPASVDSNLIVTGNFKVSGNSVAVHGTACIGGNLDADNGIVGNNFYVDGNLENLKIRALTANKGGQTIYLGNSIYGNLYVNGDITQANGEQVIAGNLTLNGKWTTNMNGYNAGVRGDLCLDGSQSQIYFGNLDREFKATGNVWMNSNYPIWVSTSSGWGWWYTTGDDNYSKYNRINLGTKGKKVYIRTGHPHSDYQVLRNNTYKFNELKDKQFGCEGPACNGPDRKWTDKKDVKLFIDRAAKPNLYYLYNYSTDLITYAADNYYDDTWKKTLTVYKVNGERFWDTYNTLNTFNYSSNRAIGSPYCYQSGNGVGPEQYRAKARPTCSVTPWFKVDGDFKSPFPDTKPADMTCAQSVKAHCDSIWEKTDGCGGAKYLVSDPLKTGISFFEAYANNHECVTNLVNKDRNNFDFSQFSKCYEQILKEDETAKVKKLYNKYLVVKITNNNIFTSSKGSLTGKFIFIFENDLHENMKIPATSGEGSYLFMYFKDGLSGEILPGYSGSETNVFIYTRNDISNVLFNQTIINGSVYAAVRNEETGTKTCAKVNNLTFNRGMNFNQEMVDDLTDAGVICQNDGSACGGINDDSSTEEIDDGEASEDDKDRFFVSTAPQLSISVESMYQAKEPQPQNANSEALQPSYVILPRVIYLPSDPYGELKDYYNVLPLNGSTLKKQDVVNLVSCSGPGSISTNSQLFTGTAITQGIYRCEASPANYEKMPFWVVVGSGSRGDGEVSFEKPSQSLGSSETVPVNILVTPHSTELKVKVNCPSAPSSEWYYVKNTELLDNTASDGCTFKIPANAEKGTYKLFDVTTTNALTGRLTFTLKTGENYTLASPYYTDLTVSSTADIIRGNLPNSAIQSYCESNSDACPTVLDYYSWPNCSYTGLWVEPAGGATAVIPNEMNESWTVSIGGSAGTIALNDRSGGKCVVIIPDVKPDGTANNIDKATMEAGATYTLYASAKALVRTLNVVFLGDVGSGNTPVIKYETATTTNGRCTYAGVGAGNVCAIPVFDEEEISLSIDSLYADNKEFSYWQCSGSNCPSNDPIRSATYDSFKVKDNETVIYVHFGESDKHCFVDEFNKGSLACSSDNTEYCVDKCGILAADTCVSAVDSRGTYTKSKWHLITGQLSDVENNVEYISLKNARKKTRGVNNKKNKVQIISTVEAGVNGTMKALFRMPQATSSYGRSSENIANSGFMLRSNVTGTEYLMLNIFVNTKGHLEAQVCTDAGSCLNGEPVREAKPQTVSTANMVMMSATVNPQNQLIIETFTGGNYYGTGTVEKYYYLFNLNELTISYANRAHEYVGFSLADPNFRLYGIGWQSEDYNSDCWDTPPTVKCSFAAKAQNGVIPLNEEVVPWVGHSGWFDSKECTPHYYYYNGNDAGCIARSATEQECIDYYKFDSSGKGLHGYGNNVKTARASLTCTSLDDVEVMWSQSAGVAHCGIFWTGDFSECSENYPDLVTNQTLNARDTTWVELMVGQGGNRINLRGTTLTISLDNPDTNEVELVLVSKHDLNEVNEASMWGDYKGNTIWGEANDGEGIFMSNAVKITGNIASFDVVNELAKGAEGFDPEKVRSIILKNHGTTAVTVRSISASCQNAVSVASCKAVFDDASNAWVVTSRINNIASATELSLEKKVLALSERFVCGSDGVSCPIDGQEVTYTIADNPYVHQGEHYTFKMSVSNGSATDTKECEVSPDPIGAISSECSVNPQSVQAGKGMPQFQFALYGCPKSGCNYIIQLGDDSETGTATSGTQVKRTFSNLNTEANALPEGEYRYRVRPNGENTPFSECSAEFKVTKTLSADEEVKTTCSISGSSDSYRPGSNATFSFKVNDGGSINITGRNYKLELPDETYKLGSTGMVTDQSVSFTVPNVGGNIVLSVWDKDQYKTSCTAELTLADITPQSCSLINNNSQFRAHFNNVCENNACSWELKKTFAGTTSSVATGSVDRNDVDVNIAGRGLGVYKMSVNGTEYSLCSVTIGPKVECPTKDPSYVYGKEASLYMYSLLNCDAGCNYSFVVDDINFEKDLNDGSYTSKAIPITFTPMSVKDGVEYTFTVTSKDDNSLSSSCTGKMDLIDPSACETINWTMSEAMGMHLGFLGKGKLVQQLLLIGNVLK